MLGQVHGMLLSGQTTDDGRRRIRAQRTHSSFVVRRRLYGRSNVSRIAATASFSWSASITHERVEIEVLMARMLISLAAQGRKHRRRRSRAARENRGQRSR